MYTPRFAISFIDTKNGTGIIDCGNSDLKTAAGAARNWFRNWGHVLGSMMNKVYSLDDVTVIVRPIDSREDLVNFNMTGNTAAYIAQEEKRGSIILEFRQVVRGTGYAD